MSRLALLLFCVLLLTNGFAQKKIHSKKTVTRYKTSKTGISLRLTQNGTITPATSSICPGSSVTLTVSPVSNNPALQWKLSTDNGNTFNNISGATATNYNATVAGIYIVVDTNNPSDTYDPATVTLKNGATADFSFTPNNVCSNTPISFTDASSGSGLSYAWDFGDPNSNSNTSSQQNAQHIFMGTTGNGSQNFSVSLTVTNSDGCSAKKTTTVTTLQSPDAFLGGTGSTQYEGEQYFTQCTASSSSFTFVNKSSTTATNSSYQISWGDGSADFNSTSFSSTTHSYGVGIYTLKFIVTGQNGCIATTTYYVFVGSNPAIGLGNPGNTSICTGSSLTFPISGTTNNPPGTTYTVTFNDGSAPIVYKHPAPADVTYTFNTPSCGKSSSNGTTTFPNSFSAGIKAANPCGSSAASVVPIYVSTKPKASFTIAPKDTICVNTQATFTNTTASQYIDVATGTCKSNNSVWTISPASGWSISSGSLGNDFGLTDPSIWTSGSTTLILNFTATGTYTIKLKTGNPNCGTDEITKTICVNPAPTGSFTLDKTTICVGSAVATTTTSSTPICGVNTYQWAIGYISTSGCSPSTSSISYIGGTSATSAQPQIQFNNPGIYKLSLTITSPGGCTYTTNQQTITVKGKPVVTLSNIPASLCQNGTISPTASVNCYIDNATTYSWSFPGGDITTANTLNPGTITYSNPGTYTVSLTVTNECGSTTASQQITISPAPVITILSNISVCAGATVGPLTFNSSISGTSISWTNSNTQIGLAGSGSTGTINSFTAVNNGTSAITGTITVKGTASGCAVTQSFTITVNPKPTAPSVSSPIPLCQNENANPLTATGTNLQWYTTATGGTPSTTAPTPNTTSTGSTTYYVSQINSFGCEGPRASIVVNVNAVPSITATATKPTACGSSNGSITISGLKATTVYQVSYKKNGTAITVSPNPTSTSGGNITLSNLSAGTYDNIIVTLSGCPSNSVGPFNLTEPSAPATPTVTSNSPICSGSTLQLTATTSTSGVTYSWNGPNNFTSTLANPTVTNATTLYSGTYTVTVKANGCTASGSAQVTINPKPSKPAIAWTTYCLNAPAVPLTATGSNLLWYSSPYTAGSGSATAPTPNTATAGTTSYFVTQVNASGCESDTATIVVKVNPSITGNSIAADQSVCSGSQPQPFTQAGTLQGGSNAFQYEWQLSTDNGVTWTTISGATAQTYTAGAITQETKFRRIVNSGTCSDTSAAVTVTVVGSLSNYDIAAAQTLCAGSVPATLVGQKPTGGSGTYSFQWEQSTNGISWSPIANETGNDYTPPALNQTTYYRRKLVSGACTTYSSAVKITINPTPVMSPVSDATYCNNSPIPQSSFVSNPATNVTYAWTNDNTSINLAASGTGNVPSFTGGNSSTPKVPQIATITVTPTYSANGTTCPGNPVSFKLNVLPTITMSPVSDTIVCTGSTLPALTPVTDNGTFNGSSVTFNWLVSGQGITLASGSGSQIPQYAAVNPGTTDLTATISLTPVYIYNGKTCNGTPVTYHVTVKPATPSANAGPDKTLCAQSTVTMQAVLPASTTGQWSQVSGGAATIADPASPTTQISGLQPGNTYVFKWSVSGFANCPGSQANVTIKILEDLTNVIDNATQTICLSQAVNITGQGATGGNGTYTYQWYSSPDNTTWTLIPGQSGASLLNYKPTQSVYLKRTVVSTPCSKESTVTMIIVQAPVTNNTITPNQAICINTAAAKITGSSPTGGNSQFNYMWEQSTDGGLTWNTIAGANNGDYDPGILTQSTLFRRKVATDLCTGPQQSVSQPVTITVRPDAKALFTPTDTMKCAPFKLTTQIVGLQQNPANGQYQWYVNNSLIGSGTAFPGYTIAKDGDSITLMLKVISAYGCKDDSTSRKFYTFKTPKPSFTVSDTAGCGPLAVTFNNTTPDISDYKYQWNFGNGQTSTSAQPGTIVFASNPSYGDTTYVVKLKTMSTCDTITITKNITVQSKPQALFTPSATVGCSPKRIVFTNTSKGLNNTYTWDFGDGTIVNSTTNDTISHLFVSGVQDTFHVKLTAVNNCGTDEQTYAIIVTPNTVHLNMAVNGNEVNGCAPQTVRFINNSSGASGYQWNFGDGNIMSTTKGVDTVTHIFLTPGVFNVQLRGFNSCSDTTMVQTINVFAKPRASFLANQYVACLGDSIQFTNWSDNATSYLWQFGDGSVSTTLHPLHIYTTPGNYNVVLKTIRINAPGNVCSDSTTLPVQIVASRPGWFDLSDTVGYCPPFTITMKNRNVPSLSATWDFGDGTNGSGDNLSHTYTKAGTYIIRLTVTVPGGCTYVTTRTVTVLGPNGSLTYTGGYLCNDKAAYFQVQANNTDTLIYRFGDGVTLTTTNKAVYHSYANPGVYIPAVTLKNNAGCSIQLNGVDTIKVDYLKAGFTAAEQRLCGSTTLYLSDTSRTYFPKQAVRWSFGDGTFAIGAAPQHTYTTSGTYRIQQIVTSASGCQDTATRTITVQVNSKPVAQILTDAVSCTNYKVTLRASVQSIDSVSLLQWTISNGVTSTVNPYTTSFSTPGTYQVTLVVGTVNGCYDTVRHTIQVSQSPTVVATSGANVLCRGNSTQLNATGAISYSWSPVQGLSCTTCASPTASPLITTPYVVTGTGANGCTAKDSAVITVMQPLKMTVSEGDSICIGSSTALLASGASSYSWSPAAGLSSTTASNPVATPTVSTRYRVIGYDGANCFTDTAYVMVGVGPYPTVNLGPDLVLSTGTLKQLTSVVTNGPIRDWKWLPTTDLSCSTCALPTAEVKRDITYTVKVTTFYGCSATDTISIKTFCESAQVFIPNAFTPDGDGVNDVFMVRASGIQQVKSLRIFNRWGELVFERSNVQPNTPSAGWDGKVNGVVGGPDVFVYTAEVVCENGSTYTYKGNVSILK